jgi:hypothetical protein
MWLEQIQRLDWDPLGRNNSGPRGEGQGIPNGSENAKDSGVAPFPVWSSAVTLWAWNCLIELRLIPKCAVVSRVSPALELPFVTSSNKWLVG